MSKDSLLCKYHFEGKKTSFPFLNSVALVLVVWWLVGPCSGPTKLTKIFRTHLCFQYIPSQRIDLREGDYGGEHFLFRCSLPIILLMRRETVERNSITAHSEIAAKWIIVIRLWRRIQINKDFFPGIPS